MEKICGIYGIKNIVNGKWYIGQSINIKDRHRLHFSELERGKHYNNYLQKSFNKYGKANFEFHILEKVEESFLNVKECFWIAYYKTNQYQFGYNLESGGRLNKQLSEETRQKLRRPKSDAMRRKTSIIKKGTHHTPEARQKMMGRIPWNKGVKNCFSEETMARIKLAAQKNINKSFRFEVGHKPYFQIPWNKGKHKKAKTNEGQKTFGFY